MHKNTFLLVVILAVVAALLVGFNMGKKFNLTPEVLPTPTVAVTPTIAQIPTSLYKNTYCGVTLSYPRDMTLTELATGSARFTLGNDTIVLACQKDIPGIAIIEENIETFRIGSVSATLYHTATPKDGTPIDVMMVEHPRTQMDVLVSGIGTAFDTIIRSLSLTP